MTLMIITIQRIPKNGVSYKKGDSFLMSNILSSGSSLNSTTNPFILFFGFVLILLALC